jgi:hypothetical protein
VTRRHGQCHLTDGDAARAAPHVPLIAYLAVAGLLVAVIFVALTTSIDVLLMGAALGAGLIAAARPAGRACVARLFVALVRALFRAVIAVAAFLIRVHFDSFEK